MAYTEEPRWTAWKTLRHYSYRDFHQATTSLNTENGALLSVLTALNAGTPPPSSIYYQFGQNARAKVDPVTGSPYGETNWPENCYAREVLIYCDQDCYISIVSLNPAYIKELTLQALTGVAPTSPQLIFEEPQRIIGGNFFRFSPAYGYAIIFWYEAGGAPGTLNIWIEGNE